MTTYNYRICQILEDGNLWQSKTATTGDLHQAKCAVLAGLCYEPRAAVEMGTDKIVFSVDGTGRGTAASVQLFVKALEAVATL